MDQPGCPALRGPSLGGDFAGSPPPNGRSSKVGCRAAVRAGRAAVPGRSGRSVGDVHPVWAYAHVPNGYRGDATGAIIGQIERFAPGFRDRIVGRKSAPTGCPATAVITSVATSAPGSKDAVQLVLGPRLSVHPYDQASLVCISARLPPHPAREATACAASMPPNVPYANYPTNRNPGARIWHQDSDLFCGQATFAPVR